jgi:hypothetical protein
MTRKWVDLELDFELDKLTNSIENAFSGESFGTIVTIITEAKEIRRSDWLFNWRSEIGDFYGFD